jgi:hypothetical protein
MMDETPQSPMDAAQGAGTLIGRTEYRGRAYPHVVEKLAFVLTFCSAVYAGIWLWNDSNWANYLIWTTTICGLPIAILIISEAFGRLINAIHIRRN